MCPLCRYDTDQCANMFSVVFEQHGYYQCKEEEGGTRCLLEDMPEGYAKLVNGDVFMSGELNDVRAPGSDELVWWYQAGILATERRGTSDPAGCPRPPCRLQVLGAHGQRLGLVVRPGLVERRAVERGLCAARACC